ncbi:deoxyhypusine synthase [Candidatus Bathyarchaeota archaeon]|nr:deoxyhypusine synthase [Candidatus Bathyarchaeota archaeon]
METIRHIKIKPHMDVSRLLEEFGNCSFTARRLHEAYNILTRMLDDHDCLKILTIAGAAIPGGLRLVISDLLKKGMFDVLVTTGANLTHDLLEALGEHHLRGSPYIDDQKLREKGLSRIYDVYVKVESFTLMERRLREILERFPQRIMSGREFLSRLGRRLEDGDSILKVCSERGIPIFCPALNDSILGLHVWMYTQTSGLKVDLFRDQAEILDIVWSSKKTGALILGGGVPKNYLNQALMTASKPLTYAVQITTDRPEYGGLSGATLEEAVSWGKVKPDAYKVTVPCDFTVALPILAAALIDRMDSR